MQTRRSFLESLAVAGTAALFTSSFNKGHMGLQNKTQKGIALLELVANDLAAQEKFYSQDMEMPVKRINDKKIKVLAGTTELYFYEDKIYKDPIYHFAFNIPENRLEDAMSWLKNKNITLTKNGTGGEVFNFVSWNANSVYWRDACGNILEFIARHNLPNASDKKFTAADILYASEIGLVVDSVDSEIKRIKDKLDLDPYRGYANNFAAIGNEHNLLIVVETKRPWFGSSAAIPAMAFPVVSTLKSGNKNGKMNFNNYPFSVTTEA